MSRLVLLDATVLVDAVGGSAKDMHNSQHIFTAVAEGDIDPLISVETIQETFAVLARRRGDRRFALRIARRFAESIRTVEVDDALLATALDLLGDHDRIMGADAIVLATAKQAGATALVTRDKGLGEAAGELWVDPSNPAALAALVSPN
ncbi:MAG: PIN domain-containing protein [Thermoleophilaceae bacterium]|nr:PIN domain-containing protein [Thermoleophilaceae bacterium]